jgi:predicted dehydrogenase
MKLGVIGSGSIVPFHLDSLLAVGFTPELIGTRPGSERTKAVAERYSFGKVSQTWREVVESNVDAFLIAPETSATPEILKVALLTGKPILVEKPVAYSSQQIEQLGVAEQVLVGYNRRHYSSTARSLELIRKSPTATFNAAIPESSWTTEMTQEAKLSTLLGNSVHVLDLLQYLFGQLEVAGIARFDDESGMVSRTVALSTEKGVGQVMITFGSPSNFFIDIHTIGKSATMRPIEFFQEFNGVSVVEPTQEIPLRHYSTTKGPKFELSKEDLEYKPGFLSQAKELRALVEGNLTNRKSATLEDAARVLRLAQSISA